MRLLAILLCVTLAGCRLDELLNPSPPPAVVAKKCYQTLRVRVIRNGTDTTYYSNTVEVPCKESK